MPKQIGTPEAVQKAMKALEQTGLKQKDRQEGEFTCSEFAEEHGIGNKRAWNMLNKGVEEGIFEKRRTGTVHKFFYRAKKK